MSSSPFFAANNKSFWLISKSFLFCPAALLLFTIWIILLKLLEFWVVIDLLLKVDDFIGCSVFKLSFSFSFSSLIQGSFNLVILLLFLVEVVLLQAFSFMKFFSEFVKGFIDNLGNFVLFILLIWLFFKFPNSSFIIITSSESSILFSFSFISPLSFFCLL